jgi:hypothetical protein
LNVHRTLSFIFGVHGISGGRGGAGTLAILAANAPRLLFG